MQNTMVGREFGGKWPLEKNQHEDLEIKIKKGKENGGKLDKTNEEKGLKNAS